MKKLSKSDEHDHHKIKKLFDGEMFSPIAARQPFLVKCSSGKSWLLFVSVMTVRLSVSENAVSFMLTDKKKQSPLRSWMKGGLWRG